MLGCVYGATKFRPSRTYNHISGDSLERQQICGNWCNNKSSHGQYFYYVWSSILRCRSKLLLKMGTLNPTKKVNKMMILFTFIPQYDVV